jgi:hypothetical protein
MTFATPQFAAGSATSRAAAAAIAPVVPTQRRDVYHYIAQHGPITRAAISAALGIGGDSLRPRVRELIDAGLVRVVDEAGTTPRGRKAERLMRTALPYPSDTTPTTPPVQRMLPLGG